MKYYQDLLSAGDNETDRGQFILTAVNEFKTSDLYKTAFDAEEYDKRHNVTILRYEKFLTSASGQSVRDYYSPNHKLPSNFFHIFNEQENQYLLGNGLALTDSDNKEKLGAGFDTRLQELGMDALVDGVAFGFWNLNHLEVFKLIEFAPLFDEVTSELKAGIYFYQIDSSKPMNIILYEPDGYTSYIKDDSGKLTVTEPKKGYVQIVTATGADGTEAVSFENYPSFPIIPLWGNRSHESSLVGMRPAIDAYDLISSAFANNMDEAKLYWVLKNSGGMDDLDVSKFMERLRTTKVAMPEEEDEISVHDVPDTHEGYETFLARMEHDMYRDNQALRIEDLTSGNKTATEINASYQPLDNKTDAYEYQIDEFLQRLFNLIGIEDTPSFIRSKIVNTKEMVEIVLECGELFDDESAIQLICNYMGIPDKAQEIIDKRADIDVTRFLGGNGGQEPEVNE